MENSAGMETAAGRRRGRRGPSAPADGSAAGYVSASRMQRVSGMSEAIAFDTHRFVKRLTESGFTEQQAETLAAEHVDLLNANLATKADVAEIKAGIEALRQETKAEIAKVEAGVETLRQETRADIAKVEARMEAIKSDLLKWLFGAMIAQGGLIVALVKLL